MKLAARLLLGASVTFISAEVCAQRTTSNIPFREIDENGVDLAAGDFTLNFKEATVGSGEAELSLIRQNASSRGNNWDLVTFKLSNDNADNRIIAEVSTGSGQVDKFYVVQGWEFAPVKANGTSLVGRADKFTYTGRDGTRIEFGWPGALVRDARESNLCQWTTMGFKTTCTLYPKTIRSVGGTGIDYRWETHDALSSTGLRRVDARLGLIVNSFAYGLSFVYPTSSPSTSSAPPSEWWDRSATRLLVGGQEEARVSYAYPATGAVNITAPDGGLWKLTSSAVQIVLERDGLPPAINAIFTSASALSVTRNGVRTEYSRSVSGDAVTLSKRDAQYNYIIYTSSLATGRISSVRDAFGATTSFSYDASGRLTRSTSPLGDFVEYTLDARGNATRTRSVPRSGSGLTEVSSTATYPTVCDQPAICNQPSRVVDAKGNPTDYTYDPSHGGVLTVTGPASQSGVRPQTRYTYAPVITDVMRVSAISTCRSTASCIGTADETRQSFRYSQQGNITENTVAAGDGSTTSSTTSIYSPMGDLLSTDGPLAGSSDAIIYTYDSVRRLTGVAGPDPDGAGPLPRPARRMRYDLFGRLSADESGTITSADAAGWSGFRMSASESYTYDLDSRVGKSALDAGGNPISRSQFNYDTQGRLNCAVLRMNPATWDVAPTGACNQTASGPNGPDRIMQNTYDRMGRTTMVQSAMGTPEERREITSYNAFGQMSAVTDGAVNKTAFAYDGFGRLSRTFYPAVTKGANANSTTDYEQLLFDGAGLVTSRRLRDGTIIRYTYDALGRLISKSPPRPAGLPASANRAIFYGYDLAGNLSYARFDSHQGEGISFTYDAQGRVIQSETTMGGQWRRLAYEYDAAGNRTKLTYPDNVYIESAFDAASRLKQMWWWAPSTGRVPFVTPTYDELGNRSNMNRASSHTGYSIDGAGRLTSQNQRFAGGAGDVSTSFGYNPAGQITSRQRVNRDYAFTGAVATDRPYASNGLNQYTTAGPASFTYDLRGNLTSDGSVSYAYDADNHLVSTSSGVTLAYDPLGRLWQISRGSDTTRFLYDGDDLVAEFNASGAMLRRYVHGDGEDEVVLADEGASMNCTATRFPHTDERGSIIALADCNGNRIAVNGYDDFGIPNANNQGRFQYTGQTWISELGMYYYKARIYSPTLGRFLQADPIGYEDGLNLHNYVSSDPVNKTDPSGKVADIIVIAPALAKIGLPIVAEAIAGLGSVFGGILSIFGGGPSSAQIQARAENAKRVRQNKDNPKRQNSNICTTLLRGGGTIGRNVTTIRGMLQNETASAGWSSSEQASAGTGTFAFWLRRVMPGGAWAGRIGEPWGNWNYGATGRAAGVPLGVLLRGAGGAEKLEAISGRTGSAVLGRGNPLGGSPYGDTPVGQDQIRQGYNAGC